MKPQHQSADSEYVGSARAYTVGFILSLAITLAAYWVVTGARMSGWPLAVTLMVLAIVQCYIQLIFFLHLNKSDGPRWRLATLLFSLSIILVVGVGSLWIMHDLDGRMVDTQDMLDYMNKEQGL